MRTKDKAYMSVGTMKDYKLKLRNLHTSHTPKDRDKVNKREDCEYVRWACDLDVIDTPSKLNVTRKVADLTRIFPTLDLNIEEKAECR